MESWSYCKLETQMVFTYEWLGSRHLAKWPYVHNRRCVATTGE